MRAAVGAMHHVDWPWHHLRGIHQGRVRAWGTAPDDVTWELGVRPARAPLLRLRGDEYLASARNGLTDPHPSQ